MSEASIQAQAWPIIGHAPVISFLQKSLQSGNIAHAYLITGPQHVGKESLATSFAQALVCTSHSLCGSCKGCTQFVRNAHPDVNWIRRGESKTTQALAKNISIEQVRELQSHLRLGSFGGTYKVVIITEAHTLSLEAANALLKTLEEPTSRTVLMLLASHEKLLPDTIASRCQILRLHRVPDQQLYDHLKTQGIERKKAQNAALMSFGLPGKALQLVHSQHGLEELRESVRSCVNLMSDDVPQRFSLVAEIANSNDRDGIISFLQLWQQVVRDILLLQNGNTDYSVYQFVQHELESLAEAHNSFTLISFMAELQQAQRDVAANVSPRMVLEHCALHF